MVCIHPDPDLFLCMLWMTSEHYAKFWLTIPLSTDNPAWINWYIYVYT